MVMKVIKKNKIRHGNIDWWRIPFLDRVLRDNFCVDVTFRQT